MSFNSFMRSAWLGLLAVGSLTVSADAWALGCDDIMNLVDVNVPTDVIVQTMEGSGTQFSADDIRCLAEKGAPEVVIEKARSMARSEEVDRSPSFDEDEGKDDEPASRFDESESLGGGDFSLPEDGGGGDEGDDEPMGNDPRKVEQLIKLYRAKKLLTASKGFYDLLEDATFPELEDKLQYYLAKSLYDMGMYHTAQHYFMQVVRRGPKNPYFKYALPRLVAISQLTGDDTELLRIVHKIPADAYPRQARNHLFYLAGRKLYERGELSDSAKYFRQVSPKSTLFLRSKYFEGVIGNQRGKLRTAVSAFRDVVQAEVAPSNAKELKSLENIKDLSLIKIGDVYYGLERYDNAEKYYGMVDRSSGYWPESLFHRAWTNFMRSDYNLTLGLLLTVESPYFRTEEYIPEATVLRALTFFTLCEYDDTERTLLEFESAVEPVRAELKAFLEKYDSKEEQKLAHAAYDAYFVDSHDGSALEKALFNRVLRNRDLRGIITHLDMMDQEGRDINGQKSVWRDSTGAHLKQVLEQDRLRYKQRAGLVLLQELQKVYRHLGDLKTQSQVIRFEVVDAQRVDYQYKMENPNVSSEDEKPIDFATSKSIIYWPFNGEFWQDELGYYRYTERGSCK